MGGALVSLAACQKAAPPEEKVTYVEAGDPLSYLAGTQNNTQVALGESDLTEHRFARLYAYVISSRVRKVSTRDFIDSQKPGGNRVNGAGARRTNPILKIKKNEKKLSFDDNSGFFLEAAGDASYKVKSQGPQSKILHISSLPNGQFFSLLTQEETEDGTSLVASYYAREDIWHVFTKKNGAKGLTRVIEDGVEYFFLLEYGLKWANSLLKLNVHSTASNINVTQTRFAARLWNQGLADFSALQIDVSRKACPPFSDLETQCLYMIDSYVKTPSVAETVVVGGHHHDKALERRFIDGDIFIFKKDLERVRGALDESALVQATFVHEIGHLLGLGHPENLENPEHRTVMGYKIRDDLGVIDQPTPYDFNALRLLYGKPSQGKKSVN